MEVHYKDGRGIYSDTSNRRGVVDKMTEFQAAVPEISSKEELSRYILNLADRVESGSMPMENGSVVAYVRAAAYWVNDSAGFFENNGMEVPENPDWALIGMIFSAACVYE
ncbi:hypothetical protein ACIP5Y_42480 [Nocardia sp. NPDC088792]|uniref:DUF7660 family protein n=1 Tax=Nocardia sp. NPDC088792 TaxID=3364332 RepID=UPI0037F204D9